MEPRRSNGPTLWVNDAPEERVSDHGFRYSPDRINPVGVSFVAKNGDYYRVYFDAETGVPEIRRMPREDEL